MISELRRDDPASVGSYRLLGRLGTGGMGQVFLGQSPGGRLVAVKVIRPELADEPGFRARFAREVTAARNVSGMFTALVVDADPEAPVPWLATAYVSGPSLAEAVDEHGPLPAPSVLALGAGLAEGLGVIHAAGVVHRDLKPANVLLAHDGPRVIDFGIARALETSMLTQSGTVMGSPGFMSPEQAEGAEVGPPSDVFSLGAVLAFAATGEGPFGSGPTPALLYRVVNREPDLLGLPEQVRSLVERCLAKDPAARPSPAELLAELGGTQLAANWLPEPIAAELGRYSPTAAQLAAATRPDGAATGPAGGDAWRATGDVASTARTPAPTGRPDETATRPRRVSRRALAGLGGAVAVAAAAVVVAALALTGGGGPPRPVAGANADQVATASSGLPASASSAPSRPSGAPQKHASKAAATSTGSPAGAGAPTSGGQQSQSASQPPAAPTHSAPPSTGTVPDVVGTTLSSAAAALQARGFHNIPYVYECYGSSLVNDVVRQSPGAGATIALTAPVQLYLQAQNCATVPNVLGMNLSDAAYTLKQLGFTNIPYVYGCYGSSQINDVVSQSPGSGTSYGKTQPVSLKLQANNC
jgi:hypothetical protein